MKRVVHLDAPLQRMRNLRRTASYQEELAMMKDMRSLVAASLVFAGLVAMGIWATW